MLQAQIIRLLCDEANKKAPVDVNTGDTPALWNAASLQFTFALALNAQIVADISNVTQVKLEIFSSQTTTDPAIATQTIAAGSLNQALTQSGWDAGTAQHGTFSFTAAEMSFTLGADVAAKSFWLKISYQTATDATDIPILEGPLEFEANPRTTAPTRQAGNKIPVGATYDGSGHYVLTGLTLGNVYKWTKGANDTSVTNGSETVTVSNSNFTAQATSVTLNGTAGAAVTAVVWDIVLLDVTESDARYVRQVSTGANYRFKNGQLQFWDQTAYTADNTKPWRALGVDNGQTVWSAPIAD